MRETAVTLSRNAGHAPAKSPVTMARNTQLEQMQQERRNADCLLTTPPEEREALAKVDGYSSDKSTRRQDGALPEDGSPCAPRLL